MVRVVSLVLRAVVGVALGCVGILAALAGLYFLARQNAQILGSEGALLLMNLAIAGAFFAGSWKLLRGIGRPAVAAV